MSSFLSFLALALVAMPVAGVFSQETDHLVGTFTSSETGLSVSCAKTANGYEGYLALDGKKYPFTGVRLLGMVSGTYSYEGQEVAFTLARLLGIYYVTSDGVSIEVVRTSDKPAAPVAAARPAQGAAPQQPATTQTGTSTPAASPANVAAATGTQFRDPYGYFSFRAPTGWTGQQEAQGFSLTRPGSAVSFGVTSHGYNSLAEVRAEVYDVQDAASQTSLRATVQPYGNNGLLVRYTGRSQGKQVVIETVSLVSPNGGGVNITGAGEATAYSAAETKWLQSIAASVSFTKPPVSAADGQWKQRLTGKELVFLQTENGGSLKISMHLCSNGSFSYSSNDSYTSGGYSDFSYAGQDAGSGTWRIASKGGQSVLLLLFSDGRVNEYPLAARQAQNEVSLNGRRYFVQASSSCR